MNNQEISILKDNARQYHKLYMKALEVNAELLEASRKVLKDHEVRVSLFPNNLQPLKMFLMNKLKQAIAKAESN